MSIQTPLILAVSLALVLASAHTVAAQLTIAQVQDVAKCQDAVNKEGRTLMKLELEAVEGCALAKLNAVLRDENGLIPPDKFLAENAKATTKCNSLFAKSGTASTRFIDQVLRNCEPVAALVLDAASDPLGFVGFWGAPTVADLARALCVETIVAADVTAEGKTPRGIELIVLDPDIDFDTLDPRCSF